jgi:hypothetical protein
MTSIVLHGDAIDQREPRQHQARKQSDFPTTEHACQFCDTHSTRGSTSDLVLLPRPSNLPLQAIYYSVQKTIAPSSI